jgi:S-formylglutathione hydrolase FrmB
VADRERRGPGPLGLAALIGVVGALLLTACTPAAPARPSRSTPAGVPGPSRLSPARRPASSAPVRTAALTAGGRVVTRTIPAGASGFRARPAVIWLPPALTTEPAWRPPVLVLLHGTPGAPGNWVDRGGARATLDAFAAAHGGRAPIVVMPDINGTLHGDTECIRTPYGGDVERYLSVDLPRWVRAHYPTSRGPWAIAGVSEGATCSAVLALRHPSTYAAFGDLSGLGRPTVGDTDDRAATVAALFGGSQSAYDRHDPLWLLAHRRYPTLAGWIEYGADDAAVRAASTRLAAAARTAGIAVRETVAAGRHSWSVWRPALVAMLPWLWRRMS